MLFKRRWLVGAIVVCIVGFLTIRLPSTAEEIDPLPKERILLTADHEGETYSLADDGNAYLHTSSGRWSFVTRIYDPAEIKRSYRHDGNKVFRVASEGKEYPVRRHFAEDFENLSTGAAGLREMIGPVRQWTEVTLQSPRTPKVADYVALRTKILKAGADFIDCRVEPSKEQVHGGQLALKCVCPAKTGGMICSKASLGTGLIYFVHGDSLWFRGWYRTAGPVLPHTLVDIECDFAHESPGIRLMIYQDGSLGAELKALGKPKYRQPENRRVRFPTDRWVEIVWNVLLDDQSSGRVRIWQDDQLVVDAAGATLPFRTAIYNRLEVGISAHSFGHEAATLFVDDVILSDEPLRTEPRSEAPR